MSKKDFNQRAKGIVDQVTGSAVQERPGTAKNAAAVELGRLGGLKSVAGRMKNLSADERSAIAKKAAKTRWKKS